MLTHVLHQTKLLERFSRLEYLFGLCLTLPFAGILGFSFFLYHENQKILRCCQKMEDKMEVLYKDMLYQRRDDESTFYPYSHLSKSASLSSLSPTLCLLHPDSVPQICSKELLTLDNMGIKRNAVLNSDKIRETTSSELLEDYHIIP